MREQATAPLRQKNQQNGEERKEETSQAEYEYEDRRMRAVDAMAEAVQ